MRTIGIDLGTTNTVVALDGNVVQQRTTGEAHAVLPSVVAFPPSGAYLVGTNAKKRRAIDPKNTIFSAKRLMGQRWHSYVTAKYRRQYPFDLVEKDGGPAFKTRAGTFTPAEIGSRVITRAISELGFDAAQANAVITVPAAFDDEARMATLEAGKRAGLKQIRVVPEPIATATSYLTTHATGLTRVAVYDLGGGTFDLALVNFTGGSWRVVAHAGDPYLGGDDIDNTVADWVADQVLRRHGWDLRTDPLVMDRLIVQCERAKVRLGVAAQTRIDLAHIDPAGPFAREAVSLDREVLEQLSRDLVSRTFIICDQVLKAAGLTTKDIDAVFLSGGTTLLPTVREGIARYFGSLPRCDYDPMEVVAVGASLSSNA